MLDLAGLFLRLELVEAWQELVWVNNMTIDFRAIDTGVPVHPFAWILLRYSRLGFLCGLFPPNRDHFVTVDFGNFAIISGVKALGHTQYDTGAAIEEHQKVASLRVDGAAFDFTLTFHIREYFFTHDVSILLVGHIYPVKVIRLVKIGRSVVSGHKQLPFPIVDTLNPLRNRLQVDLA